MNDITPFQSMNDEALADRLRRVADSPRFLSPTERAQLLRAAADRLGQLNEPLSVQMAGDFVFVQAAPTGTLLHPLGDDGVFLSDLTYDEAARVVEALGKMEDTWTVRSDD